ncbi:hypothetical protein A0H81_09095 [Grifola frondosa]|uniref:Carboxymuconolactone decarboxylase-like domain-containing protein n=1 Tax=Grifola frondosa TaxID=5627 RepID=A0A1C7M2J8_GRIFR|nr:hypothetical protein A0H81_09095 [Grifola frondosa]
MTRRPSASAARSHQVLDRNRAILSRSSGHPSQTRPSAASCWQIFQMTPARVPYVFPASGEDPVADSIRVRRHGSLSHLDGVLLNDSHLAGGWNALLGALRDHNSLSADMRELLILRVGALNNAAYEWIQHEPVGRSAGLTTEQLREIRLTPAFLGTLAPESSLTPALSAAMLFADFMTKSVHIPQPVFDTLKQYLDDKQMVDAAATVGGWMFRCLSRNNMGRVSTTVNCTHTFDYLFTSSFYQIVVQCLKENAML